MAQIELHPIGELHVQRERHTGLCGLSIYDTAAAIGSAGTMGTNAAGAISVATDGIAIGMISELDGTPFSGSRIRSAGVT